jgi:hypothetical protein
VPKDEKYCPVLDSVAVLFLDAFMIFNFKLFCYDFCWYKDAIELEATRMSYAEIYVKFQEAIKTMVQGCKL